MNKEKIEDILQVVLHSGDDPSRGYKMLKQCM